MKKVNIISTVVQRQISGAKIPTGNNVTLNGVVDIDEIRKELSKNFISFDDFKSYWEIKTDAYGNKYIYSPLHIATQDGITMYAGKDGVNIPSIYDGLPIDSQTIYWENGILKAKIGGGTLGSLTNVGEWADSVADVDRIMVQKKGSDTWEAMDVSGIGSASFENISESGEGNSYTSFELSEDKKSLTLVKGETFALASDLEDKWTTDEELINNWNTAFGWGNHAEAGYALQTSLDLVSEKLNNFLEGSDTDSIINKWKELEAFLGGLTESDNLAEILSSKANQSELEETNRVLATKWTKDDTKIANWDAAFSWGDHSKAGYVTIAGNEDVTGVHNFVNGLKIGGKLIDKPKDDVIYIDANLVVRGGITMYGDRDANIPPILNSIPTAGYDDIQARGLIAFNSKHFVINNGVVSAIQGSAGLDVEQLEDYLTSNKYATEDWVKQYVVDVNTGNITAITKQMVIDALGFTPYDASNPNGYITSATLDGYLPLTGGVIDGWVRIRNNKVGDGTLYIKGISTKPIIRFDGDVSWGYLGFSSANNPCYYDNSLREYRLIHSGNIGSQSVNYATSAGNADTLDGNHISDISKYIYYRGTAYALTAESNLNTIPCGYYTSDDNVRYTNAPITNFGLLNVNINGWYKGQLLLPYNSNAFRILYRSHVNSNGEYIWCNWRELAYIDDNVASATKLSDNTSYTIWGQEFFVNGKPKNVNGHIFIEGDNGLIFNKYSGGWYMSDNVWMRIHGDKSLYVKSNLKVDGDVELSSLSVNGNIKADFSSLGVITTSNYDSYALRSDGWLKVGANDAPRIYRASGVPYINFRKDGSTDYGSLGVNENGQPVWFDDKNGSGWHTLIHSQNIGSQSVNYSTKSGDADTLDGVHLMGKGGNSGVMRAWSRYDGYTTSKQYFGNGNVVVMDPKPTDDSNLWANTTIFSLGDMEIRSHQLAFGYGTDVILYRRVHDGPTYNPWKTIAFTDSNVASATKLSDNTSFTIWGQTFFENGKPKSVSGDMTLGLNCIYAKATDLWSDGTNSHPWYGIDYRFHNTGVNSLTISNYFGMTFKTGLGNISLAQNGNVGIGTTYPEYKVDIFHSVGDMIRLYSTGESYACIIYHPNGGKSWSVGSNNNNQFYFYHNGAIRASIDGNGNYLSTGGITMYSARILKNIVDERGLSLNELSVIKPTRYTWKDGRDSRLHFGGIADDIQQVLPEVVYKTEEGVLTMDYGNAGFAIAASLIKPVVDHEQRIKALEKENELLKQELNRLRA